MANIYLPGHGSRNYMANQVASGGYSYGGTPDYSNRVVKAQPTGGGRAARLAGAGKAGYNYRAPGASGGSPGMGVGGGGASGGGGLAGAYQSALDSANAANEARYAEGHQGYTDLRSRTLADLAQQGNQGKKDIDEQFNNAAQDIEQQYLSRGLSASTAGLAPRMAAERERGGAQARLAEALRRERIGYDVDLTDKLLGFVERREDEAPDMNQMLALQQQQGYGSGAIGNNLAAAFGGGFGQVGFNAPMMGGYSYGGGSSYGGGGLNATQRNALLANKGKLKYASGYSLGGYKTPGKTATPSQAAAIGGLPNGPSAAGPMSISNPSAFPLNGIAEFARYR